MGRSGPNPVDTGVGLAQLHRNVTLKAPTSAAMHSTTQELLPDPSCGDLNMLHPIYIRSAKGSRVYDVDGNAYIDLALGYGPHILGHAPDVAIEAAREVLERGLQYALHSPYQEPLARLIAQAWPGNEMVLFTNSGTEATMHAVRVARAYTGKTKLALMEGAYHGSHDYVIVGRPAGIPAETKSTVVTLPFLSDVTLERIRSMRDELGAVMIEPVHGANPRAGQGEWLKALAAVCRESNVVLIFDEVVTGFRLGYAGAQELFGVTADLVTYGKIVGGGLPAGAITGRSDIMELYAPRHPKGPTVHSSGTFSGNPMSMATGAAVLGHLHANPHVYSHLNEQSDRLVDELNRFFDQNRLQAHVIHAGSVFSLDSAPGPARDAFRLKLYERGIMLADLGQFFISAAHSKQDMDEVIDAMKTAMLEVREEGYF